MDTGVYSRRELLAQGEDDASIRDAVARGGVKRLRRGWYAIDSANHDVVAAVRRGGCLSCVSSLREQGFWIAESPNVVHTRASKHLRQPGFCGFLGRPAPVTTAIDPPGTALACAVHCLSEEAWIAAADSVLNARALTVDELRTEMPGAIGATVDTMLGKCDPRSQSGTESVARVRLRRSHFRVTVQPQIPEVGRADLRVGRLLIECDSKAHHTKLLDYQNDRRRDRRALVGGWLTMRLTYDDVVNRWDEVLADIYAITNPDRHRVRRAR